MQYDEDARLMIEFQKGDKRSFETLFKKYSGSLINFIYRFTGNRHKAEELAQDVLLKVYMARKTYSPKAKFSTWIYRIATNTCLNELRRHEYQKHHVYIDDHESRYVEGRGIELSDPVTPEEEFEKRAFEKAFKEAIDELPGRQRAAFLLNRFHNTSYREVAEILGCSESSVKSLIHRATVALKERLKAHVAGG